LGSRFQSNLPTMAIVLGALLSDVDTVGKFTCEATLLLGNAYLYATANCRLGLQSSQSGPVLVSHVSDPLGCIVRVFLSRKRRRQQSGVSLRASRCQSYMPVMADAPATLSAATFLHTARAAGWDRWRARHPLM